MGVKIGDYYINIRDEPNICPHCHIAINPTLDNYVISHVAVGHNVIIMAYRCTNNACKKSIIAEVNTVPAAGTGVFVRFLNGLPKGPDWPKPIVELKSGKSADPEHPETTRFIKTYLQSLQAEHNGLDEIAGMGYRKAIEYLVKDWAIQANPQDQDIIEGIWLGQVIADYYRGDLREILERATWLGNDQSHYNKLFEEYEIQDLRELIDLILVELDRQYKMKHYIETIQKRK